MRFTIFAAALISSTTVQAQSTVSGINQTLMQAPCGTMFSILAAPELHRANIVSAAEAFLFGAAMGRKSVDVMPAYSEACTSMNGASVQGAMRKAVSNLD
ncbi:hypothetical protein J4E08_09970 [Sagittula sp. NFXS13]|uniref:hypothetical protein n=1 Tax=Sagittula sp. NFXS13 TaxID=2819095 RepID=UPI0032DF336B